MDWDLKMPPWDLAELDPPPTDPNMGPLPGPIGPGSGLSGAGHRLDCSVDLKLGGLGDFGPPVAHHHHQAPAVVATAAAASSSSPSGSSKRARAPSSSSQNAACLVDGCKSDLSGCREYHRRHKVCEAHSKTPIVMVGGQEQRFCQQCSRFHLLVEFDEVKRSCRKRLDGHNRRRRKPQPDPINTGNLFTNHQGNRFSSYPHIFPTAVSDPAWPVIVKTEEESLFTHHHSVPVHFLDRQHPHQHQHHHFSSSFPRSFKEGKHFPFLQDSETLSICQPLLNTLSSAESSSNNSNNNNNNNKLFANGLSQVLDSDCALSLLSSPPQSSSAINLGQIVPSVDRIPICQPLISYGGGLELGRYSGTSNHMSISATGFTCSGMEDENNNVGGSTTVLVPVASDPEMSCQGLFGVVGGEGSSDGGSQALPFSWQ